jgi:hypothetical protein
MMWSYYGSKSKVVHLYPRPECAKIIEPFAGSARYALRYFDRDVLLVDKYEVIVKIWHYLQAASEKDIMGLPELTYKQSIKDFDLSEGERLLMSFLVARGAAISQYVVQQFSDIPSAKKQIASQLFKIRHWKIQHGDYKDIPNERATWFIDPPYQTAGYKYKMNNAKLDFSHLAAWSKERLGQIIVCENDTAAWLPFLPMQKMTGAYDTATEAIWTNRPTHYETQQLTLAI